MKKYIQKISGSVISLSIAAGCITTAGAAGVEHNLDSYYNSGVGTYIYEASTNAPFNGAYVTEKDGELCVRVEYAAPGDRGRTGNTNTGRQIVNNGTNTSRYAKGIIKSELEILHVGDKTGTDCAATSLGFVGSDGTQATNYGGRIYATKISSMSNKELKDANGQFYSIGDDWASVAFIVNTEKFTEMTYLNDAVIQAESPYGADIKLGMRTWFFAAFGRPAASTSDYYIKNYTITSYDCEADIEVAIADAESAMTQLDIDIAKMVAEQYSPEEDKAGYLARIEVLQNTLNSSSSLDSLSFDYGEMSPEFSSDVTDYTVTVPYGSVDVPVVNVKASSPVATVDVIPASDLSGQTLIIVTSKDGTNSTVYTINYVIAKNTDAGIYQITSQGGTISPAVESNVLEYFLNVPYGTTQTPDVNIVMNDSNALYDITYPEGIGDIIINTTADNGTDKLTYVIHTNVMPPFTVGNIELSGTADSTVTADVIKDSGYNGAYDISVVLYRESGNGIIPVVAKNFQYEAGESPESPFVAEFSGVANSAGLKVQIYTVISTPTKSEDITITLDNPIADHGVAVKVDAGSLTGKTAYIRILNPQGELMYMTEKDTAEGAVSEKIVIPEETVWSNGIYTVETESGGVFNTTNLDVRPFSSDTSVKNIQLSAGKAELVSDGVYDISVEYGVSKVPTLTAELTDKNASYEYTACESVPGIGAMKVTAEDGTVKEYTLNFVWSKDSAYLKELSAVGATFTQPFDKNVFSYTATLPAGSKGIPEINAVAEDPAASVNISKSNNAAGSATIAVISQDGTKTNTYTIKFTVKNSYSGGGGGSSSGGGGGGSYSGGSVVSNIVNAETNQDEDAGTENEPQDVKSAFDDIKGHWAEADIAYMKENGYVSGKDENNFEPDSFITRAEFCALVVRVMKLQESDEAKTFNDVADNAWYHSDVSVASSNGIVNGFEGAFRPEDTVTREEMACMIYNAYKLNNDYEVSEETSEFSDADSISEWALGAISAVKGLGLITGVTETEFAPKQNATRAQTAVILKRLLAIIG